MKRGRKSELEEGETKEQSLLREVEKKGGGERVRYKYRRRGERETEKIL